MTMYTPAEYTADDFKSVIAAGCQYETVVSGDSTARVTAILSVNPRTSVAVHHNFEVVDTPEGPAYEWIGSSQQQWLGPRVSVGGYSEDALADLLLTTPLYCWDTDVFDAKSAVLLRLTDDCLPVIIPSARGASLITSIKARHSITLDNRTLAWWQITMAGAGAIVAGEPSDDHPYATLRVYTTTVAFVRDMILRGAAPSQITLLGVKCNVPANILMAWAGLASELGSDYREAL